MFGVVGTDEPRVVAIARQRRELDAQEAAWLAAVAEYERSEEWRAAGYESVVSALRAACNLTHGVAKGYIDLARKLRSLPEVASAFGRGDISRQHAAAIAEAYTPERASAIGEMEQQLVEIARFSNPRQLRAVVRRFTDALDGDDGSASDDAQHARRRLHMSKTLDNVLIGDFALAGDDAEVVCTAVTAEAERDRVAGDPRTPAQRRADALVSICRQALDNGEVGSTRKALPHATIVIDLDRLNAPLSLLGHVRDEAAHMGRLSLATIERLTCDCAVSRVITKGHSEILDTGRTTRVVSPAQWRALVVRDQHCQAPGCDRPPGWCEAHHVVHWSKGGRTDLGNLILLCHRHHRAEHGHDPPQRE
jgi:hypothetical protein